MFRPMHNALGACVVPCVRAYVCGCGLMAMHACHCIEWGKMASGMEKGWATVEGKRVCGVEKGSDTVDWARTARARSVAHQTCALSFLQGRVESGRSYASQNTWLGCRLGSGAYAGPPWRPSAATIQAASMHPEWRHWGALAPVRRPRQPRQPSWPRSWMPCGAPPTVEGAPKTGDSASPLSTTP